MAEHPVFGDIRRGDLEEVQRRVLSDPGVLEEELGGLWGQRSSLTYAIHECRPQSPCDLLSTEGSTTWTR